jgi:mRNA-degrading endonuclease RelE of RelBE toxin-antitoxin system
MPSYDLQCHTTAKRELQNLADDDRERITDTLSQVAAEREPTQHEAVRHLEGQDGLFRVRAGDVRAVCTLRKPDLLVVSVGYRKNVYDGIDSLDERLSEAVA